MMRKSKKFLIILLSLAFVLSAVMFVSCSSAPPTIQDQPTITLNYSRVKMEIGSSVNLTASLEHFKEQTQVEWNTYDENVASVGNDGKVVALAVGSTWIVAQAGDYSASCEVLVVEPVTEKKDINVNISQKTAVLNAESSVNTVLLTAFVTVNGVIVNADITWESSDQEYATVNEGLVTALKNGKEVIITASAVYDGVEVSANCKVIIEGFVVMVTSTDQINIYPNETYQIDFDIYVGGVLSPDEKQNVTYTVDGVGVAKVSSSGLITAMNSGNTVVTLNYGAKSAQINLTVGVVHYVDNAERFMAIDGAQKFNRYILTDNIDLSGYFYTNPAINADCLIEEFNGELVGDGYTVSGYHRLSTSTDGGFSGLFKVVGEDAIINNVGFDAILEVKDTASFIVANNYGKIEDCLFRLKEIKPSTKDGNALAEISNGIISNSVAILEYAEQLQDAKMKVANNGYGTYADFMVVCAQQVDLNENCSLYATESDLIASGALDQSVFNCDSIITLKNKNGKLPLSYPSIQVEGYSSVELGSTITLNQAQVSDGVSTEFKVFDATLKDVTALTCVGNEFTPASVGKYYVVYYAKQSELYSVSLKEVKAVKNLPALNNTSAVLRQNETVTLEIEGKQASDYLFVSNDQSVATVSASGVITAVNNGNATISVTEKTTADSYKVLVTVVDDYKTISTAEEFKAIGNAKQNEYYVLTKDIFLTNDDVTIIETNTAEVNFGFDREYAWNVGAGEFAYSTTNKDVVAISDTGMIITGKTAGTATVVAKSLTSPLNYELTIKVEESASVPTQISYKTVKRATIIETFSGILDGQGYKVSVEMDVNNVSINGLFRYVKRNAIVKNLNYYADITYTAFSGTAHGSAFIGTLQGELRSCFVKADLTYVGEKAPGDDIGMIETFTCEKDTSKSSFIYNCIFDMSTVYDGQVQDVGYAIRRGTNPFGYAYDSVFIRNGITPTFFGDFNNGGSAVECTNAHFYKTMYDFINANNGYKYTTSRVAVKIVDGAQVYTSWPTEWTISSDEIYLCGKKITDIEHEPYVESKSINITENQGVITWISDRSEFEVIINDQIAVKTTQKSFDLFNYIIKTYGTAQADYNVLIKANGTSGVAVFSVVELNNANFVSEINATKNGASFKYFVLKEDIEVAWNSGGGDGFMFFDSYANVYGQGYSVKITANAGDSFRGIFRLNHGLWTNAIIKLHATYVYNSSKSRALLFGSCNTGGIQNCVIEIVAIPTNASGQTVKDEKCALIAEPNVVAKFTDCLFILNSEQDTVINVFGTHGSGGAYLRNSAVVRNTESHDMALSYGPYPSGTDKGVTDTVHYMTLKDFIDGNGFNVNKQVNSEKITITQVKQTKKYLSWSDIWSVEEGTIYLCGRKVAKVVVGGDDTITDAEIPEI